MPIRSRQLWRKEGSRRLWIIEGKRLPEVVIRPIE
jgi:hypothetical protein